MLEIRKDPAIGKELSGRFDSLRSFPVWPFKIIFELTEMGNPIIYIIDICQTAELC
jgi:hypothetical protein